MKYLGLLLALLLASCTSTSEKIEDIDKSVLDLQKLADQSLPVARSGVSRNAREFYSVAFIKDKGGFSKAGEEATSFYQATIKVLGDRRPYTIEVEVTVQKKSPGGQIQKVGYDKGLARVIIRRIQKALYQRRERRNIIDDFKVF